MGQTGIIPYHTPSPHMHTSVSQGGKLSKYSDVFNTTDTVVNTLSDHSKALHESLGISSLGYSLNAISAGLATVSDSQVYFFGCMAIELTIVPDVQRLYIPKAGIIKSAFMVWRASVAGSGENISIYIRKNNTSDTLIQTIGDTQQRKIFMNTSLNIAVAQGDYIEIKIVCPAWGTNLANLWIGGVVYLE